MTTPTAEGQSSGPRRKIDLSEQQKKARTQAKAAKQAREGVADSVQRLWGRTEELEISYTTAAGKQETATLISNILDPDRKAHAMQLRTNLCDGIPWDRVWPVDAVRIDNMATILAAIDEIPKWLLTAMGEDDHLLERIAEGVVAHQLGYFQRNAGSSDPKAVKPRVGCRFPNHPDALSGQRGPNAAGDVGGGQNGAGAT